MSAPKPAIILVQPQMGENIGAAARAMANFGLEDLKLVNPRDGWPSEAAKANAAGALDIMPPAEVFETTADALKEYHNVYATTARPRDMRKNVMTSQKAAEDIAEKQSQGLKTAILFGGERAGLTNDDIALAHNIISIPVNPDFSSINLGQSVLLVAYEIFQTTHKTTPEHLPVGDSAPVSHSELNEFIERLETELDKSKFFRTPEMKPTMMRNIRNSLTRAALTQQETRTFQGIISALIGNKMK